MNSYLTDDLCNELKNAAETASKAIGLNISFAIADESGLPKYFVRFGDALALSTILVPAKAFTAAVTETATQDLEAYVQAGKPLSGINTNDPRICLVAGGVPLKVNGKTIGAFGVGGGSQDQDLAVCKAVIDKFNELLASVN